VQAKPQLLPDGRREMALEFNTYFAGANVQVVADDDLAGWMHALDVVEQVGTVASRVQVVEAQGANCKDAADHLAAGHRAGDFLPVSLDELRERIARHAALNRARNATDLNAPTPDAEHTNAADEPTPPEPNTADEDPDPASAPSLAVRWANDAINKPPLEQPILVEGLLRAGELCVIGAPRAIGKSWFAMNLAILIDRGEGFLAGGLRVVRQANVLYCQGEIDEWESCRRWQMLSGPKSPPTHVAETFDRWRLRTIKRRTSSSGGDNKTGRYSDSHEWSDAQLDPRLEAAIAEHGIDVLIIDPWAVYFAGNENSNDETEAALDKLRDLSLRYRVAIVILHHIGKGTDAREPEDLWRGASRLADWASTRVTIRPHYNETQARNQGMSRQQARRYADILFLRRSTPTDDFAMHLDPATGWWDYWRATEAVNDDRRSHLDVPELVDACQAAGGSWPSTKQAADALGVAEATARKHLAAAHRQGALEPFNGSRGAHGWRIPGSQLQPISNPQSDDDSRF
jgi:hypothetical protein